jgi:phospholipase C
VLGPTNPNRLYMWTGTIDPGGTGGGPITDNSPAHDNVTLSWTTYPERLQQAGVSWQVYQEEDNYDDNALAWFKQFASAPAASPLWQRGMRKGTAGWFETDARAGRLPQVSWLVAPAAQSEHPSFFPAAGAEYIASKLDAIASNEDLWHKTLFILTYDENDGLFDHVPPPVAPRGTRDEYVGGEPIGLGFRGRPGVLGCARPHVSDPHHRAAVRRPRAEHQRLPPPHLRRLHLRPAVLRPACGLPAVAAGHHAGRGRGQPAQCAAGSLRQPHPAGPGG